MSTSVFFRNLFLFIYFFAHDSPFLRIGKNKLDNLAEWLVKKFFWGMS
jgi:hypothetical protein